MTTRTHRLMAAVPIEMASIADDLANLKAKLHGLRHIPGCTEAARRVAKLKRHLAYTAARLSEALWTAEDDARHHDQADEPLCIRIDAGRCNGRRRKLA